MVAITVSAPLEIIAQLKAKAHSMSKVFQFGAEVVLEGGIENINTLRKQLKEKGELLDVKTMHNEDLIKRFAKMEVQLGIYKERLGIKKEPIKKDEEQIEAKYGIPADKH